MMTIWKVAEAKRSLSQLLRDAEAEPQLIHKRDHLVAAVLGPEEAREYLEWRKSRRIPEMRALVQDLMRAAAEEDYRLPESRRADRPNPIAEALRPEPGARRRQPRPGPKRASRRSRA